MSLFFQLLELIFHFRFGSPSSYLHNVHQNLFKSKVTNKDTTCGFLSSGLVDVFLLYTLWLILEDSSQKYFL